MVLTSSGEILTNNHVVSGSTSISVVVVSTGATYTAKVVGTDPTADIAVLQLQNASGLATANVGTSSGVAVGDAVTAVGNAGGTGGAPSSATGSVTALGQAITASDADGSNAEHLTGLIQVDANIQAGDSGGPLYNAKNQIIGIDTAASTSRSTSTVGFAIPISTATSIATQIESGVETSTIHIGYPAFLGVQLSTTSAGTTGGATIAGTVSGSAAAKAGLAAGDTITAVNGTSVTSASSLSTVMGKFNPGDQVKVTYSDSAGASHSVTVTLGSGPAD
jgi:S1-C subfamily serine protease